MPQNENDTCFFIYKILILLSWLCNMLIFLFMSQIELNQYDFQNFNLSLYIAPSFPWFVLHITIIDFYKKLWFNRVFAKIALVVCIGLLIYEFAFCLLNYDYIFKGYYAWLVCHAFCIAANIAYILKIRNIIKQGTASKKACSARMRGHMTVLARMLRRRKNYIY